MDGIHDMGGMEGFGKLEQLRDQQPFHSAWEPLPYVVAILAKQKGWWTFDGGRHAIERMPTLEYINSPYFDRVLVGMATLAVENGLISHADLEHHAGGPGTFPLSMPIGKGHASRTRSLPFSAGDRVTVLTAPPPGHLRAPRYCQGKTGTVLSVTEAVAFPGEAGHGLPVHEQPTYHVCFQASDLWGEAEEGATVVVDLWESYLSIAEDR
ncbi:nitrile hydratase subunit beta [Pseudomonas sp. NPDC089752]|uniref:nitrile hydratase subunit beta n=1 Tax=Pseudomonas sp. NPDC089752 TaxID=3364472 RepID=UPI00382A4771